MQSARSVVASDQFRDLALLAPNGVGLMDLWLILVRRRYVLWISVAAICGAAIIYLQARPAHYQFRTPVQLAKTPDGPVEAIETILAKLQESFVPLVSSKLTAVKGETVPDVVVRNPGGGDLVVLESLGELDDAASIEALHKAIVDELAEDHKQLADRVRASSEAKLAQLEARLVQLIKEEAFLSAQMARLAENEKVTNVDLNDQRRRIDELEKERLGRLADGKGDGATSNLLLVDIAIQQHQELLARFEDRLNVSLARQKDFVQQSQIKNFREQEDKKDEIRQMQAALSRSKTTMRMAPAPLSKRKTEMGGAIVISLSLVFGVIAGIFVVYFCEFAARAQAYAKLGGGQQPSLPG